MSRIRPYHVNAFATVAQLVPAIMYAFMGMWMLTFMWLGITLIWAWSTYLSWRAYN